MASKSTKKPVAVNLDTLNGAAANLRALAGDEMTQAALALVRERLDLTPEKLALLFLRILNPLEILNEGEEQIARGVSAPCLRGMKEREELPRVVNG